MLESKTGALYVDGGKKVLYHGAQIYIFLIFWIDFEKW